MESSRPWPVDQVLGLDSQVLGLDLASLFLGFVFERETILATIFECSGTVVISDDHRLLSPNLPSLHTYCVWCYLNHTQREQRKV